MDRDNLIGRWWRHLVGRRTASEGAQLEEDLQRAGLAEEAQDIEALWRLSGRYRSGYQPDAAKGRERLRRAMQAQRRFRRRRIISLAAAASLLLFLSFLTWTYLGPDSGTSGEQIVLQSGPDIQSIRLPDGTSIQLNRNSRLQYRQDDAGRARGPFQLEGEAYFEVAPQREGRFLVQTDQTEVEVLGTAFNLRAYPGESATELEVEEGTVAFRARRSGEELRVGERQRARVESGRADLETDEAFFPSRAWRSETMSFRDVPLDRVAGTLERYYGVRLKITAEGLADCPFTSPPFRPEDLESLLTSMELIYGAELLKNGEGQYVLRGGACPASQ